MIGKNKKVNSVDIVLTKENFEMIKSIYDGEEVTGCFTEDYGNKITVANIFNEKWKENDDRITSTAEFILETQGFDLKSKEEIIIDEAMDRLHLKHGKVFDYLELLKPDIVKSIADECQIIEDNSTDLDLIKMYVESCATND